uniref:Gypsy retrotransposon integrase-like protein 1 n=1 Tax=Oryzias sinensis TaxID=183150 RepID=A0A8C7Y6R4_9TELE
MNDVVDLSDSFLCNPDVSKHAKAEPEETESNVMPNLPFNEATFSFDVDKNEFVHVQKADPSIAKCLSAANSNEEKSSCAFNDGRLVRNWFPPALGNLGWNVVQQIVVPEKYRCQILSLAHDGPSGHLGVRKTYHLILRYFFWPALKSDVTKYCRLCHICQMSGKPNQVIPPAPLHPIPPIGEPFEHLILDCVGPLPKTNSGHQYLLTLMCAATRYPEAIPLRTLRTKAIIKDLVNFFSTFGFPQSIQSDQGSNFTSKLFGQVVKSLYIKHRLSSAYHPQSQGALERFHQTLKNMLKKFCLDSGREWDEGLPFLMLATRESVQESTGFSPAELMFGNSVHGPLKHLKDKILSNSCDAKQNVLDYVSSFRERLHRACEVARSNLSVSQKKIKRIFDQKVVQRHFDIGDKVITFLPVPGSVLQAKFSGPYMIQEKLSETDYVVSTPERRRKSRVCHINMLKPYVDRIVGVVASLSKTGSPSQYRPESDGLRQVPSCSRLQNSEILDDLASYLSHLSKSAQEDLSRLIHNHISLFSVNPSRTSAISHDIDVGEHFPIRQHAYPVNPTKRALLQQEVKYLLENRLATTSSSSWTSPCLLVPKPDKTVRFCTDFRKVNQITKPDSYPLPRMEDCVDRVGSARFVTKLDLLKGYWQDPLTPPASEISAFVTPERSCLLVLKMHPPLFNVS